MSDRAAQTQLGSCSTTAGEAGAERGATLIEILVALALLGTIGVALLNAFFGLVSASDTHRDVADAEAGAWQYAEWASTLDGSSVLWSNCVDVAALTPIYQLLNPDANTQLVINEQRVWEGDVTKLNDPAHWRTLAAACPSPPSGGGPLHYIAFTVTAADGSKRSGHVVLRGKL